MASSEESAGTSSTASVIPYSPNSLEAIWRERSVITSPFSDDRRDYLHSCAESALLSSVYFLPIVARYESKPIVGGRT